MGFNSGFKGLMRFEPLTLQMPKQDLHPMNICRRQKLVLTLEMCNR